MKRKLPLIGLCLIFGAMALYYGLGFYRQWREYRTGEQTYENLTQYVHLQTPPDAPATAGQKQEDHATEETAPGKPAPVDETEEILWPVVDFEALREINSDVVGWIFIEGTNINYPVVQGRDNSYYMNRLFDGSTNGAGSIFMDYRNEADMSCRNTILYGHHMKNGTMFQQITGYKQQDFYDQHPTALFMTPEGNYKIEWIAGYVTDLNSDAWKIEFTSDREFSLWLSGATARSNFISTTEPDAQDRAITLSTCTYEYADARYVLVGILK